MFTAEKEPNRYREINRSSHVIPETEFKPEMGDVSDEQFFVYTAERELDENLKTHRSGEVVPETLQSEAPTMKSHEPLSPNISIKEEEKPQEKQQYKSF